MIKVELTFPIEHAVALFRNAGLDVEKRDVKLPFKTFNGNTYEETIHTWTVINPNSGKAELLERYFRTYLEHKKQELFIQEENKLKILNLFHQ